jgi:hypothetical protein
MRNSAMRYDPVRGDVVVSRHSGSRVRLAGLQRAQRFAGEAFGHEEHAPLQRLRPADVLPSRWRWWLAAAFAAMAGLAYLHFR